MRQQAGATRAALDPATPRARPLVRAPSLVITDPLFYLGRRRGGDPARHLEGRLLRPGRHGAPVVVAGRAAVAGGRHPAAHHGLPGRADIWTYRRNWSAWNLKVWCRAWGSAWRRAGGRFAVAAHIRLLVGLIAALFVLRHWLGTRFERWRRGPARRPASCSARSAASPPCLPTPAGRPGRCTCCRSTSTSSPMSAPSPCCSAPATSIKVPAFGSLGSVTWENLASAAALLAARRRHQLCGIWLVRRTSTETFFRIAYVLMFIIAVELIRNGLVEMSRG